MAKFKLPIALLSLFLIKACGGGGGGSDTAQNIVQTVVASSQAVAPVISSANSFNVSENQTYIGTALATAANYSSALSYSLSGVDADAISINSSTGVMTFNSAPDFETKNAYVVKLNVAAGSLTTSQDITISISDVDSDNPLACKTASYATANTHLPSTAPSASSSDSVMNYYTYSWQSIDFENLPICLNYYEATATIINPWKTYIEDLHDYSKFTIGQVVPLNVSILAEDRALISDAEALQFNTDKCTVFFSGELSKCVNEMIFPDFANRGANGGVNFARLPNGGEIELYQDLDGLWVKSSIDGALKIIAHEYFHVHQNGLKFMIEANNENNKFAIPKAWPGNNALYHNAPTPKYMPDWFEEGGAEFGGIILAAKYMENASINGSEDPVDEFKGKIGECFDRFAANGALSLEDFNKGNNIAGNGHYECGLAALMYLWLQDDANYQKIMIDYYANWAEAEALRAGHGWSDAFKNTFKKDGSPYEITTFYNDFNNWIRSDTKDNIKGLVKTKNQMLHADLIPTTENTPRNVTVTAAPKVIDNGGVNKYFIDSVQQKSLVLKSGKTYTFIYPAGHPLRFSQTTDGTHNSGMSYVTDVDILSTTTVTLKVTSSTPKTLYYFCEIHSGMGGIIKIVD